MTAILKRFILETRKWSRWIWNVKMHLIMFVWPQYLKRVKNYSQNKFLNGRHLETAWPIWLVNELVRGFADCKVCTKFYQNRANGVTAIVLTDTYIYIYKYIYTNLNEQCFWGLGTLKRISIMVSGLSLVMRPTVIASFFLWKFAKSTTFNDNLQIGLSK